VLCPGELGVDDEGLAVLTPVFGGGFPVFGHAWVRREGSEINIVDVV